MMYRLPVLLNQGWQRSRVSLNKRSLSSTLYKPGDHLPHGWRVANTIAVPELSLPDVLHLKHEHCGAELIHMSNPGDETNTFSVNFKTVPQDSTGVAHILEHVTLCGSTKYPVRDPFMKMLNRSLSTFMNAMTAPDFTMYPFATQNKKDYYNLMSVYLDLVFRPLLKETDFSQEGWRLAEENGKLVIKGVVFNEMKGVYADSQSIFGEALLNNILPSNTYGNVSGGLPEKIPDLTFDKLKEFYRTHYCPDNAKFCTYGSFELEGHLEAISHYLPKQATSKSFHTVENVPSEPRWSSPKRKHIQCPPDATSTSNTLAVAYLLSDITDVYENFVIKVISELLIDGPNAPFYQTLIEAGLGSGFSPSSGFESSLRDTIFSIGLQGISSENATLIEDTIQKTFQDAHKDGFDPERIQAILHRTELSLKKQVNNFGLNLIFGLSSSWNHSKTPLVHLQINQVLERFKKDIQEPNFLKDKIDQYFLKNSHKLILTMTPDEKFVIDREKVLADVESRLVSNLNDQAKKKVLDIDQKLKAEQETKENEETIGCLPSLQIGDIPLEIPTYKVEKTNFGQFSVQPTNGVSFFRSILSTEAVESNDLYRQYLPLFTMVLTQIGAGDKYNFRQFDTITDLYTGGLGASTHFAESPNDVSNLNLRGLILSSFCLERNSEKMFELWKDLFWGAFKTTNQTSSDSSREALSGRIANLVTMSAVDAINGVVHSGHQYAMTHAASKLIDRPGAQIRETEGGLTMVRFLSQMSKTINQSSEDVFDILASMAQVLLRQENFRGVALNMTDSHQRDFLSQTEQLLSSLPQSDKSYEQKSGSLNPTSSSKPNTFVATPFPVHYCGLALPTVAYNHEDSAPLRILAKLLTSKFLLSEVREKGGAYGGGATASPSSGIFTFYSYRDPNFHSTLEAFDKSIDWISNKDNVSERDIVEAKLGVFQAVDKPVLPGSRGLGPFLSGITDDMFLEHRRRLLGVTHQDLMRVSEIYLTQKNNRRISVIGPEASGTNLDESWEIQPLSE